MKYSQQLILIALTVLFISKSYANGWNEGVSFLRQSALTSPTEEILVYIYINEEFGVWVSPKITEKLAARVTIDSQDFINQVGDIILKRSLQIPELESVRICFMHTHPLASILPFIADPKQRKDFYRSDEDPLLNTKFTVPPSRTDIATIITVNTEVLKHLQTLGYTKKISVVGAVVDPVGVYYFREFTDVKLKHQLFKDLKDEPNFSDLDLEEQNMRAPIMEKEFFKRKAAWTTLVNKSGSETMELLKNPIYFELQKFYAGYADSTQLRFTSRAQDELPCQGFMFN